MNNLPQDPNQPISPPSGPNSSGSVLKGSEGSTIPEGSPTPETPSSSEVQTSPESLTSQEKIPIPSPKAAQSPSQLEVPRDSVVEPAQVQNVVDRTDQVTSLHEIKEPKDKLTEEADDEEEHFIEEVEKHHGNL